MHRISLYILILFISNFSYSQARLILNNGGILTISNAAFVVIDNPNPNAITRNTSGHIISEGEFNRLKWNIGTTAGSYIIPFGIGTSEYLPVSLTTSGATGATGNLTFAMYPVGSWLNTSNLPTGVTNFINNHGTDNSAFAIDRFWYIDPNNYTTKPALTNLIFTYRDIEYSVANNFISESNLIAQRYKTPTNEWDDYMPGTVINTSNNTATISSLPSAQLFSWWTLVDNAMPLPVELSSLNVKCNGDIVTINWQTVSEKNNAYFVIERSADGINFIPINKIISQNGNSTQLLNYNTIDIDPLNGKSYYRLKQVDNDGKYTYTSLALVSCAVSVISTPVVSLYPNPTTNFLTLDIKGLAGKKRLLIYNMCGQEMITIQIPSENENTQELIDVSTFANATYIVRLDVNNELFQIIKFIKN